MWLNLDRLKIISEIGFNFTGMIVTFIGAITGIGWFLSRKKYNLLTEYWHYVSIILEQMLKLTSGVTRGSVEDCYQKFSDVREKYQNEVADRCYQIELVFSDNFAKEAFKFFNFISIIESKYSKRSSNRQELYEINLDIEKWKVEVFKKIKLELTKWKYFWLR